MKKSMSTLALAAVVAAGTTLAAASTATAATNASPDCNIYNLCYYWGDNYSGSHTGMSGWEVADVMNPWIEFESAGAGQGQGIGNNAGSIRNLDYQICVTIYEDEYFGGRTDNIGKSGGLTGWFVTKNNNRAHRHYFC